MLSSEPAHSGGSGTKGHGHQKASFIQQFSVHSGNPQRGLARSYQTVANSGIKGGKKKKTVTGAPARTLLGS